MPRAARRRRASKKQTSERKKPAHKPGYAAHPFDEVTQVMERLLAPDGCPWDREQTLATLKPFLIEESYEVLDVMEGSPTEHCDELGDLLFQIVFQSALRKRQGHFGIAEVCRAITNKLVRRHPHVFGDLKVSGSAEVLRNWEKIKRAERGDKDQGVARTLDGVPRALPSLLRATRVSEKARRVGFDWPEAAGARAKVVEELGELDDAAAAKNRAAMHSELGDLLFALVNYARKLELDPEQALRDATDRFTRRFEHIEARLAERGKRPETSTLEEMDALWNEAKRALARSASSQRQKSRQSARSRMRRGP